MTVTARSWDVVKTSGRIGTGNWCAFDYPLDLVFEAAKEWRQLVAGRPRLWLCWNISDNWCLVQQSLVKKMGWTPVVGWDPNCVDGPPPLIDGALAIDFNRHFHFQALWPHFPLEFAFLWSEKLAFWHADLLLDLDTLRRVTEQFERLNNGEMCAVPERGGKRDLLNFKRHRYWELLGCTTAKASAHQFEVGCGWWRHFWAHPNVSDERERTVRRSYYYDQGVGIMYWKRKFGGKVFELTSKQILKGHFSEIGSSSYVKSSNKSEELCLNFDLKGACMKMGILDFLPDRLMAETRDNEW